jgi:hypothetical protein
MPKDSANSLTGGRLQLSATLAALIQGRTGAAVLYSFSFSSGFAKSSKSTARIFWSISPFTSKFQRTKAFSP